jgi:hypothetical protein
VQGVSLKEAKRIGPQRLLDALDGLPEENAHCADLAVNTLQKAISDLPRAVGPLLELL